MNILDRFSLKGKVALVTGGTGLYGRQIAVALAQAGAETFITTRQKKELGHIEQKFKQEGYHIQALYMDQEDPSTIGLVHEQLARQAGQCDILVNNAVARTMMSWEDPYTAFAKSMEINATGLFVLTRTIGNWMAERGSGSIINIGSIQGVVGPDVSLYKDLDFHSLVPDYFFHKGGMVNFTKFVAAYYGSHQIRCNCLSPGGLWTERMDDTFVGRYSERTMLGRLAGDTDLMGSVVFLASDASVYITGTNLIVDGGYTAK